MSKAVPMTGFSGKHGRAVIKATYQAAMRRANGPVSGYLDAASPLSLAMPSYEWCNYVMFANLRLFSSSIYPSIYL